MRRNLAVLAVILLALASGCLAVPAEPCVTQALVWDEPGIWRQVDRLGFTIHRPVGMTPVPDVEESWNATAALLAVRLYSTETGGNAAPHVALEWHDGSVVLVSVGLGPATRVAAAQRLLDVLSAADGATAEVWLDQLSEDESVEVEGPFRFDEHFAAARHEAGLRGFGTVSVGRADAAGSWDYEFGYATANHTSSRIEASAADEVAIGGFEEGLSEERMRADGNAAFAALGLPAPTFLRASVVPRFGPC